jgi:hypothetical protein
MGIILTHYYEKSQDITSLYCKDFISNAEQHSELFSHLFKKIEMKNKVDLSDINIDGDYEITANKKIEKNLNNEKM